MQQSFPLDPRKSMTELLTTRIRATFGPLHLVSLYSGRWAAVWFELVPDEAVAKLILAEDAAWFNTEPDQNGVCNPTHADKADAILAVLGMLRDLHSEGPDARLRAAIDDAVSELIYAQEERQAIGASTLPPQGESHAVAQPADDAEPVDMVSEDAVMKAQAVPAARPADEKTPPKPATQAAEPKKSLPWENLDGISETKLLYPIPPDIQAKMEWVMDNVPGMRSKQLVVRNAVQAYLDAQIATHYKP